MGIYYEWHDYRDKGLSITRLRQILIKKGMNIMINVYDDKTIGNIVSYFDEIKEWGIENLSGIWSTMIGDSHSDGSHIELFFTTNEDAMAFKLRWL